MPPLHPIVIETRRLRLRPFRIDDWVAVHGYATDPLVSEYQDWGPNSERDTKKFVAKCIDSFNDPNGTSYYFSICRLEDDVHIGGCLLTLNAYARYEASLGYTISRPAWNQGYASEAAASLLKVSFNILSLRRVTASCDSSNFASRRVLEKIGMRLARCDSNARFFKGRWRDWLEYEITESVWKIRRAEIGCQPN